MKYFYIPEHKIKQEQTKRQLGSHICNGNFYVSQFCVNSSCVNLAYLTWIFLFCLHLRNSDKMVEIIAKEYLKNI